LASVKNRNGDKKGPLAERLAVLLDIFSPWDGISLTYRQFAAELGAPVSEAAIKKWPQRRKFPADIARLIVKKAAERGLSGVTLEWLLWGEEPAPRRTKRATPSPSAERPAQPVQPAERAKDSHGQYAARIARALAADLSHNELGQWSSLEVQHTVIWALKDLARRLWVLRFNMGETFELTDDWAGKIGLPVRPPDEATEPEGRESRGAGI
jgi:hypothetical protein